MSTFSINTTDYCVEEISYDDMMLLLDAQEQTKQTLPVGTPSKGQDLAQRIAQNANQQLPDWLLSN